MDSGLTFAREAPTVAKTMQSNGARRRPRGAWERTPSGLGSAVRARRRALGLDQLTLCDLAGVGPAFLYQLEHGKATLRLDKVVDVLRVLGLELHLRTGKSGIAIDAPVESDDA
jgi:y4mF family transcriptional regulator